VEIAQPDGYLKDCVSGLAWRPGNSSPGYLSATLWDGDVRCFEVDAQGKCTPKLQTQAGSPVLGSCWTGDGSALLLGCADGSLKRWTMASNTVELLGKHDAGIKEVRWIPEMNVCVTGSWDKTIKVWDGRAPQAQGTINAPERVYCMDTASPRVVVGCADKKVHVFDLRAPTAAAQSIEPLIKMQLRSLACFPNKTSFAVGSIEGRVAIHYFDQVQQSQNFAFKCHRAGQNQNEIYAVNVIKSHPLGTFVTCGSDGTLNIWDKDSRQRLKAFNKCPAPISAAAFNDAGTILAYSPSYDWSKGHEGAGKYPSQIFLHACSEMDVKPRPKK